MADRKIDVGTNRTISSPNLSIDSAAMGSTSHTIKSPRSPITPTQAVDSSQLGLTQTNDIQHLFETYMQQIGKHADDIKAEIDAKFDDIVKQVMSRKNIVKQQVDEWKCDKLMAVSNEISSAGQYEEILLNAQKQCNRITNNDKLPEKEKQKQIKQIKSQILNTNKVNFKKYNDSNELTKYINNVTSLIEVKYEKAFQDLLSNYGEIAVNSNNPFLCVPVLNLCQPIKGRESKNGYKISLKWQASQPLNANNFIIRCLAVSAVDIDDEKKRGDNGDNAWKSLIFKVKATNQENNHFEAFDIETVFSFDKMYKFRIEFHIQNPVNLLIGSNEQIYFIENKPPDSKNEFIELQYVSHFGNSYEGHPNNLLSDDKGKKYRSKHNKDFGYNESDWIVYKIKHSGVIRTYLPKMISIKNTSGTQALRKLNVSIGCKADMAGDEWFEYDVVEVNQNSDKYQQCVLQGIDWKVIKQMKTQFIKLQLVANYGEARGAQCRFKIQEFKLYGLEFK